MIRLPDSRPRNRGSAQWREVKTELRLTLLLSPYRTSFHADIPLSEIILNQIRWNNTTQSELKSSEEEAVHSSLSSKYLRVYPAGTVFEQGNTRHACDHCSYTAEWPGWELGSYQSVTVRVNPQPSKSDPHRYDSSQGTKGT